MVKICIIGDSSSFHTAQTILSIYQSKGFKVFLSNVGEGKNVNYFEWISEAKKKKAQILIIAMNEKSLWEKRIDIKFHIMVYLNGEGRKNKKASGLSDFLEEKNVIIINSDNKEIFPFTICPGTTLITCGINSKASVTASSVICDGDYETVQCCIQRAIRTISGERLEPQEFSVSVRDDKQNVAGVLAAVTAAMADDMEISELNLSLL